MTNIYKSTQQVLAKTKRRTGKLGVGHVLCRSLEYILLQTEVSSRVYWGVTPALYKAKNCRDYRQYDTPIKPLELLYVDPDCITQFSPRIRSRMESLYDIGSIKNGDWDLKKVKLETEMVSERLDETTLYKSMQNHFVDEVNWEETELYESLCEAVKEGNETWHGCTTVADIERRFERLDSIYESIATQGYRTQSDLREPNPSFDEPYGFLNERINEISIDIGRNGEMMLLDNRHRLIIAQLLGLEKVPVSVIVRHKKWVEKCEEFHENGDVLSHPDYRNWPTE